MKIRKLLAGALLSLAMLPAVLPLSAAADTISTEYPIWVGGKQITDDNKDDVLEDGGKVKFSGFTESDDGVLTGTLKFNDATITEYHTDQQSGERAVLYIDFTTDGWTDKAFDLTIEGKATLGDGSAFYGIDAWGNQLSSLTIDGDITAVGRDGIGICMGYGDLEIAGGSLTAAGENGGIYASGSLTVGPGIASVTASSLRSGAIYAGGITLDDTLLITEPAGGELSDDKMRIVDGDGNTVATVTIKPRLIEYPIWVGGKRITNQNKDDVLKDGGSVKFTATESSGKLTGTLTLDDPEITAYRTGQDANGAVLEIDFTADGWEDKGFDLTVEGSAEFAAEGAKYGIGAWSNVPMNLTVNGDITAGGDDIGIAVMNGGLTVSGGEVTAQTNENSYMGIYSQGGGFRLTGGKVTARSSGVGLSCDTAELSGGSLTAEGGDCGMHARGDIDIGPGIEIVKASGRHDAILADLGIILDGTLVITEPEGGKLSGDETMIVNGDGSNTTSVTIKPRSIEYPIWVGNKRITDDNKDDVLEDGGKVQFSGFTESDEGVLTGTLTLNNPTITEYRNDDLANESVLEIDFTTDGWTDKAFDLTIEGSADLTVEGARYGIGAWKGDSSTKPSILTIDGNFTAEGTESGIAMYGKSLTISGGSLRAVGRMEGIRTSGSLTVGPGIETVKASSESRAIYASGGITLDDSLLITEPEDGKLSGDSKTIVDEGGTIAKEAAIASRRTVIWLDGDGSELDRADYAYGEDEPTTDKIPTSQNEGEIFDRWDDGTVNGSVTTYRPVFRRASAAIIRYELKGGTMDGKTGTVTLEAELGSTITLPAPTREGYSFVNWGDPAWKAGAGYEVEGDHSFTAQWQENGQHTHHLTLVEAAEAGCTQAGNSAYYTCDSCDLWFEDAAGAVEITDKKSVIIPALGHNWSPWKQTKAPTALKKGEETRVCTRCGEEETRSIPARGSDDDDDDDDDRGSRTGARGTALESGSWMQTADGWTYRLSAGGLATGWHYLSSGGRSDWYFFDSRGIMQTGWLEFEGSRYYLNPVSNGYMGAMQTGWQLIEGKWYYFETVAGQNLGHMYVSRVTPDGYRTGSDGAWDGAPAAGR